MLDIMSELITCWCRRWCCVRRGDTLWTCGRRRL